MARGPCAESGVPNRELYDACTSTTIGLPVQCQSRGPHLKANPITSSATRLGIFGGTFDPVHYGHLLLAEQCREHCALDEVWFLPSGSPPHKQGAEITPGKQRFEMLELAIAGHAVFSVNDLELRRSGPTFTVDTLQSIHENSETAGRELFFLIGADSLSDLVTWREPKRIAQLATIVAVNRGGDPLPDLGSIRDAIGPDVADRIQIVEIPGNDVSSTDIRQRVRDGRSIRFMTPRAVEVFIEQHGLYGGARHEAAKD